MKLPNVILVSPPELDRNEILICTEPDEAEANAQAIANLPNLIQENEKLKAQCETYAKDYNEMVKEVLRLSRENSKMKEMVAERIKELEK